MRLLSILPPLALLALSAGASAAPAQIAGFSSDDLSAAATVQASREDTAAAAQACGEQFPDKAAMLRGDAYFWEQQQFKTMQAADLVRDRSHIPMGGVGPRSLEAYRKHLAEAAAKGGRQQVEGLCGTLVARLLDKPGAPPLIVPEASQRMEAVYSRTPHPPNEVRDHDFFVGCMIDRWNRRERDIAAMTPHCQCTAKVVTAMADAPDPSEYQAFARRAATPASGIPAGISQATQDKLQACAR